MALKFLADIKLFTEAQNQKQNLTELDWSVNTEKPDFYKTAYKMSGHQYLYTDQVSSLSDEYKQKRFS